MQCFSRNPKNFPNNNKPEKRSKSVHSVVLLIASRNNLNDFFFKVFQWFSPQMIKAYPICKGIQIGVHWVAFEENYIEWKNETRKRHFLKYVVRSGGCTALLLGISSSVLVFNLKSVCVIVFGKERQYMESLSWLHDLHVIFRSEPIFHSA